RAEFIGGEDVAALDGDVLAGAQLLGLHARRELLQDRSAAEQQQAAGQRQRANCTVRGARRGGPAMHDGHCDSSAAVTPGTCCRMARENACGSGASAGTRRARGLMYPRASSSAKSWPGTSAPWSWA